MLWNGSAISSELERSTSIVDGITTKKIYGTTLSGRGVTSARSSIPFFERYPLRTSKRDDFTKFKRCIDLCAVGYHLTREGVAEIATIMQTMNHQKPRGELIRILRDQTPNIPMVG